MIQDGAAAPVFVNGTWTVDFRGVADVPTAFAAALSGEAGTADQHERHRCARWFRRPIDRYGQQSSGAVLGLAGPPPSEEIYYIVSGMDGRARFGFVNNSGTVIGQNLGDGKWYLSFDDVHGPNGIRFASSTAAAGTRTMTWTTFAVEDDANLFNPADQGIASAEPRRPFGNTRSARRRRHGHPAIAPAGDCWSDDCERGWFDQPQCHGDARSWRYVQSRPSRSS